MYLMYVDESGDSGMASSPTRYFVLSGLVFHELRWRPYLDQLVEFRRRMQRTFNLRLREEIHAARMINHPGDLQRIKRNERLTILRFFADEIATMSEINIINVVVDKQGKPPNYDVFGTAWKALLQRFENTITARNFPGPKNPDERGMLFPDDTTPRLSRLLRQMRRYNPIPHHPVYGTGYRFLNITNIIEDPNFRNSQDSYFIQAADLAAYLLYQHIAPNAYMRKGGGHNYFNRLEPVLCRVASRNDPQGIVWL